MRHRHNTLWHQPSTRGGYDMEHSEHDTPNYKGKHRTEQPKTNPTPNDNKNNEK